MDENEEIKKANEVLDNLQQDKREQYLAHLRLKYILDKNSGEQDSYDRGMEAGRKEGKSEGKKETQKEVVLNMYKKDISIEDICEIVKLPKEEVEKIIEGNE